MTWAWVIEIIKNVNVSNTKKIKKNTKHFSWYRDSKSYGHKTISGKGLISRIK